MCNLRTILLSSSSLKGVLNKQVYSTILNCLTPIDRRVFVIVILSFFRVKSVSEKDILMMLN